MKTLGRLVSIAEVARIIGVKHETASARLKRLDQELGGVLLVKGGGVGRHARYSVRIENLKRLCSQWFADSEADWSDHVDEKLKELEARINAIENVDIAQSKNIGELRREIRKIRGRAA